MAGSAFAGTALGTALAIGSFALGPLLVAFAVGVVAGIALTAIDNRFGLSEKLGRAYDAGLKKLAEVWDVLGNEAEARYQQLMRSQFVHDLDCNVGWLAEGIARRADQVRGQLTQFW